jgi:hypothetical protein
LLRYRYRISVPILMQFVILQPRIVRCRCRDWPMDSILVCRNNDRKARGLHSSGVVPPVTERTDFWRRPENAGPAGGLLVPGARPIQCTPLQVRLPLCMTAAQSSGHGCAVPLEVLPPLRTTYLFGNPASLFLRAAYLRGWTLPDLICAHALLLLRIGPSPRASFSSDIQLRRDAIGLRREPWLRTPPSCQSRHETSFCW